MPFVLGVDHDLSNPPSRFIAALQITAAADGVTLAETKSSAAGHRRFTVPDGAGSIALTASIAPAAGSTSTKPILSVKQTFSILRTLQGAPLLVPDAPANPRVQPITGWGAPAEPKGLIRVRLDLRFVDTTDRAQKLPGRGFNLLAPRGSRVIVLESTEATPFCWLALLPPAVTTTQTRIGALVFLRPRLDPYTDSDDVQTLATDAARYFGNKTPVPPFGLGDATDFPAYQDIGLERQLVDAGKKVVLLFPFPHDSSYGAIETGGLVGLAESAVTALAAEGHVGPTAKLTRLALGGYSHGGKMALLAFNAGKTKNRVDELYLFDPASFNGPPDKAWLGGGNRRLRMIGGGYQHQNMLTHEKALGGSPNATCWPPNLSFWATDADYHRGLSDVRGQILRFDPLLAGGSAGAATAKSGIFLAQETPGASPPFTTTLSLQAVIPGGVASGSVSGVAHEEAAAIVHAHSIDAVAPTGQRVTTAQRMRDIVTNITANENSHEPNRLRAIRHEWVMFGGVALAGQPFKGFFQLCLENSAF